jgi:hypothetical protein
MPRCAPRWQRRSTASRCWFWSAPENEAGGNSRFTAGAFRCVYNGVDDLRALMPDLTDDEVAKSDFGTYTEEEFFDDMGRVTEYRTDPELCEILIRTISESARAPYAIATPFLRAILVSASTRPGPPPQASTVNPPQNLNLPSIL